MGFSVSGATAVVFIGLLVSAATLYPAVDRFTERRSDALSANDERALARQNTAVAITNTDSPTLTDDRLTVEIENTGANTLSVDAVDLLVDGEYVTPDETTVDGDAATDVWAPGETLVVNVDGLDGNRVKVTTGPGVAATAEVA
ncbi:fla cluster protein FlaF [Halosegnis marinus]|uniref:Fla cluster protein FlaF n=1 Tax=Halosegnis marinus TaxID=3034023 RepID=A0ABD5ZPR2_9EURY|nr:fla cluster protein FlaF [Halosegnis sp. DT85]